jgi:hypothetical protein
MTNTSISLALNRNKGYLNDKKRTNLKEYNLIKLGFLIEQNYSQIEREKMLKNVDFVKGALSSIQL